jgi:hypothetical protein
MSAPDESRVYRRAARAMVRDPSLSNRERYAAIDELGLRVWQSEVGELAGRAVYDVEACLADLRGRPA